jgi:uncharacterized damage-inducible protein DinB
MEIEKVYRNGAIGALMDEYERAALYLIRVIQSITDDEFEKIVDQNTQDEACRSIQTIARHVVMAGYGYANYIREQFGITKAQSEIALSSRTESVDQIKQMLTYTEQTLQDKWLMTDEEITNVKINSSWGPVYDLEQLLEHAIVHILRHRRQVEKFVLKQRD